MSRLVLEGVPRIEMYSGGKRCPEDIIIPSAVRALLEYLGDRDFGCKHCLAANPDCKIFCTYSFLVGVSGAAFYLSWKEGWDDNAALFYMSEDAAGVERHIFEAVGYAHEWVEKKEGQDSKDLFRRRIIESLDRGMPVLGYGVVGPPEPSIITGYDEGGDVLIGWSFFQNFPEFSAGLAFEPGGYFRKRDWYDSTLCLLVIGEKRERPPLAVSYRRAIELALQVARVPMVFPQPDAPEWYRDRHNGFAAYTAWAANLAQDANYPANDEQRLRKAFNFHNHTIGIVAEARWYAGQFLTEATNHVHYAVAEHLLHAAACCAAEHALMWQVWDLAGGNGCPDGYRYLPDAENRRKMIALILAAREKDEQAVDYLATALRKWR